MDSIYTKLSYYCHELHFIMVTQSTVVNLLLHQSILHAAHAQHPMCHSDASTATHPTSSPLRWRRATDQQNSIQRLLLLSASAAADDSWSHVCTSVYTYVCVLQKSLLYYYCCCCCCCWKSGKLLE